MAPLTVPQRAAREARRDEVVRLYDAGLTGEAIALELGVHVRTIRRDREARSVTARPRARAEAKRARAVELRRLLWTVEDIAAEVGVSLGRVAVYLREIPDVERAEIQRAIHARRRRTAPRVTRVCGHCGEAFELTEAQARAREAQARYGNLFCSTECAHAARWQLPDVDDLRARRQRLHARHRAAMDAEGLITPDKAAELTSWSPAAVRRLGKVPLVRREFGGVVRLGVNAREVLKTATDSNARGKLAKLLAALNGTEHVGRPPALSTAEVAVVVDRRAAGRGWRTIADELNAARPLAEPVSHMAVKRAHERATAAV